MHPVWLVIQDHRPSPYKYSGVPVTDDYFVLFHSDFHSYLYFNRLQQQEIESKILWWFACLDSEYPSRLKILQPCTWISGCHWWYNVFDKCMTNSVIGEILQEIDNKNMPPMNVLFSFSAEYVLTLWRCICSDMYLWIVRSATIVSTTGNVVTPR